MRLNHLKQYLSIVIQVVERSLLARLADGTYTRRGVQQLSGGQWRRLSLALTLAFAQAISLASFQFGFGALHYAKSDYINNPLLSKTEKVADSLLAFLQCSLERTATSCNLLVLDEVLQHLDSEVN